jgi:methionyl-tRNA formyltransferase
MKIIFAGRDNSFNRGIINWLSKDHEVVASFFLEPDRFTFKGRMNRIKKRIKRYGLMKVLDEMSFHFVDRLWLRKNEPAKMTAIPQEFRKVSDIKGDEFVVDKMNSKEWVAKVKSYEPDIIFSVCSSVIFKPQLYNTPRYGTLVLHEGITPQYKGLHTPLWALMKGEPQYLGYTLLKVNDEIDGGGIVSQYQYQLKDGEDHRCWSFVAHYSIVAGLDKMRDDLKKYEEQKDNFQLEMPKDSSKYPHYTWMGLSEFLKLYFKKKKK